MNLLTLADGWWTTLACRGLLRSEVSSANSVPLLETPCGRLLIDLKRERPCKQAKKHGGLPKILIWNKSLKLLDSLTFWTL